MKNRELKKKNLPINSNLKNKKTQEIEMLRIREEEKAYQL